MTKTINIIFLIDIQNGVAKPGLTVEQGGGRYVRGAERIAEPVGNLMHNLTDTIFILGQDFHPPNHKSFTSVDRVHCVQGTESALFIDAVMHELPQSLSERLRGQNMSLILHENGEHGNSYFVIRKGTKPNIDSYGISKDNNGVSNRAVLDLFSKTSNHLQRNGVTKAKIGIGGFFTNYCVECAHADVYRDFIPALNAYGIQAEVSLLTDISIGIPKKVAGGVWPDLDGAFSRMASFGTSIRTTEDVLREVVGARLNILSDDLTL